MALIGGLIFPRTLFPTNFSQQSLHRLVHSVIARDIRQLNTVMSLCSLSTRAVASGSRAAPSFIAFYTTVAGLAAWRNWGASATPVSLVPGEEAPAPKSKPSAARLRAHRNNESTPLQFKAHRERMKTQFPEGWSPPRKLSRQAMEGLRVMHAQHPELFTTPVLAEKFKISPEAVRRILKSKWEPTKEERMKLAERAERERQQYITQRRHEERLRQLELQRQQLAARRTLGESAN